MSMVIEWQQWILAPPRRSMPGLDWEGRGPDYLLRTLAGNLARRGGTMLRGTEAVALMERHGACVGVEARNAQGRQSFDARSVVLADGGFQGNAELVSRHICRDFARLKQRGASTGIGDGLRMAQALGAEIRDLNYFYGHLLSRDAFANPRAWPYPQLDELGIGGVMVGADGRRFADEGRGGVYLANAVAKLDDPLSTWAVFDHAVWEGPGRDARIPANPHLLTAGGTILQADTLQALAAKAGLPGEALEQTVRAYRDAVQSGQLSRLDPPRSTGGRRAWLLDQPPYYATPVCAGITYTMGGIAIDADARVVKPSGECIPGLYAAGSTTAGLEGRRGPTYVGGLMKGLVFGLRAANHAAARTACS